MFLVINVNFRYSKEEEISIAVDVYIKLGVPLIIFESILIIYLFPEYFMDVFFFDDELNSEISDRPFYGTSVHRVHSHGDIPDRLTQRMRIQELN